MPAANYTRAQEGFDLYTAGVISSTNYPWYVSSAPLAGVITAGGGVFGGNSMNFSGGPGTSASGFERAIPSVARLYNDGAGSLAASRSLWGFGFWFNATRMVNGSNMLLGLGTSAVAGNAYQFFGYQQVSGAPSLVFPSNITSPLSSPYLYPIVADAWYWVDIMFAINAFNANTWRATYLVDSNVVQSDVALTWGSNNFASGNLANRLKFYVASNIDYKIDDLVIRTANGSDADWVGSTPPVLADINALPARRIYSFPATANGSVNQWASSDGTTPNYQAATDPTGAKYVVADSAGLQDLYKWNAPGGTTPTGITAISYRGASTKSALIQPIKKVGSTISNMKVDSGPNRFFAVSENDGTNPWTQASIEAAEFGQQST